MPILEKWPRRQDDSSVPVAWTKSTLDSGQVAIWIGVPGSLRPADRTTRAWPLYPTTRAWPLYPGQSRNSSLAFAFLL